MMNESTDLVLELMGERIGIAIPPEVDLTPYATKEELDEKIDDHRHAIADVDDLQRFCDEATESYFRLDRKIDGNKDDCDRHFVEQEASHERLKADFEGHRHEADEIDDWPEGLAVGDLPGRAATSEGTAGAATTAARSDHSHPVQTSVSGNAGSATKLQTARTVSLSGAVSGSGLFDGTGNLSLVTTSNIVGLQLGNTVGSSPGTAAAGTSTTAARSDHEHPLQTSVTGNAGTASKLATARTITLSGDCSGFTTFDGSGNVTIATTVVNGGVQLGSVVGQAAGTASAGSATTAARSDHIHPLQTTVSGNAGTATKLATLRTITLSGVVSGSTSFDGSGNVTITTTGGSTLQLGSTAGVAPGTASAGTASTAARSDHVHPLQTTVSGNAGSATKLQTARTISLSGAVSGSSSFDGSGNLAITTTSNIVGLQLGSTVGQAAGTASAGTATTAARSDHIHPLQTSVTGNAGTATKLATARTITISGSVSGSASFDGSGNITIATTGGISLGSTVGQAAGTASAGSATTAAKSDHVHPLQTTVSGNAGTATKLATSRTITLSGTVTGSASFDGSANASMTTRVNNTSGSEIKFWTGTSSQLPSSRTSDTIYFVTD